MLPGGVTVASVTQPVSRLVPEHRSTFLRGLEASATLVLVISALSLRSRLLVGIAVLAALFVLLERALPLHPRKVLRPGWRTDLVHLVANNLLSTMLLLVALITVGVGLRLMVPHHWQLTVAGQPHSLQFAEAFLLASVFGYWAHRASHRVPWLWRFHRVHHSSERLDWLAAARLHPVDQAFQRSCIVLPLFALGFSTRDIRGIPRFCHSAGDFHSRQRTGPLRPVAMADRHT